jgi:hypothetical protein
MFKHILLIAASLILLSACAAQTSKPSTDITVEMTDFAYSSPAITIPAGEPVTLTVKNVGQAEHDFVVEAIDATTKVIQDNGSNAHTRMVWSRTTTYIFLLGPEKQALSHLLLGNPEPIKFSAQLRDMRKPE